MDKLKQMRLERGWSQQDLADRAGVGQDTVSGLETGRRQPYPSTMRKLAAALDIDVSDFFREVIADPKAPTQESAAAKAVADFRRFRTRAKRLLNEELEMRNLEAVAHILDEAQAISNALLDDVGWRDWEETTAAARLYRELVELVLAAGMT